ncbi:MAG: 23S rRNA (uracil(1939)-C(5))-methyltransferase RlmD, partial [Elusimicrobia bacterium]|nr:23S rRNA (uracil(1939)-C(5))-methyltransferase RlmD [Elusimicrobiota bacterium]
DELEVKIGEDKSQYATAQITSLIHPGPGRIDPPCPHHFKVGDRFWCGGCDWQHLDYFRQLAMKKELVRDALERIGKIKNPPIPEPISSPDPWRYRNKVQVPVGIRRGALQIGFYHPGTHEIVDFKDCLVQPELSVRIVAKIKAMVHKYSWEGWLRHIFIRTNEKKEALVALVTRNPHFTHRPESVQELIRTFPAIVSLYQNIQPAQTSVILGPRWVKLWGKEKMEETIGKINLAVSPGAFLQVNTRATEKLYQAAEKSLLWNNTNPGTVLDLYCGAGAIALWISPYVSQVVGIEENREAIGDAIENAKKNKIRNVQFASGKVEAVLPRLRISPDAVILDPPRRGCSLSVLKQIRKLDPRRILYISCNPATFARDLRILMDEGFRLLQAQPVDLFPQTSHIEVIGLLERQKNC